MRMGRKERDMGRRREEDGDREQMGRGEIRQNK